MLLEGLKMIQNKSLILLVLLCCVQLKEMHVSATRLVRRDLGGEIHKLFLFPGKYIDLSFLLLSPFDDFFL